jgi:hypothetical protein
LPSSLPSVLPLASYENTKTQVCIPKDVARIPF